MQRLVTAVAVIAALGLVVAVPTAAVAKTSKTDKSQNKALKTQGKSIKSLGKSTKALGKSTKSATSAIAALKVIADRGDKNAKSVLDAAPAIIQGLTDLKNGLTAAGAGLTSLKTLATSQEYGFGQVSVVTAAGPPPVLATQVGSFVVTPDLPDAVQQAQTTQQFVANDSGTLLVAYGVRSNESDGTGASNPAALCRVTVTNQGGTSASTTGGPLPGLGAFVPVPLKSALTSTTAGNETFPFGPKVNGADADNLVTFSSSVGVTAGNSYTVGMSCVDTSPDPNDPSA
jgi:hypothetical protein